MFTPWPPARTGVAHYASMIVPALRERIEVELVTSPDAQPATHHGPRIYQLGNNPYHAWIYEEAMRTPGVIVLHDVVLHHLIVEMTLARGDVEGYIAAMRANHGEAGAAWARGRAAGLHSEMGNFLLPASVDVANRSRAVIVHNRWSADRLRSLGVTTPIHVIGHPYQPQPDARARRHEVRARHGFAPDDRVIGFFGFLTSAKRADVVLAAYAEARRRDPRVRLLIVGQAAPDIDIATTGYVSDQDFGAYFAAADRLVNLRYPSAGETSGTLIRALEAGKPVAVSDYAQFAEMPDDCVVKIPFDRELDALVEFFAGDVPDMSAAQRRWIGQNATVEAAAEGYIRALRHPERSEGSPVFAAQDDGITRSIPLFPALQATLDNGRITLRNAGDFTLRARTYGQPGYRIIAKWDGGDRWLQLPRDLAPGESVSIAAPATRPLRLYHAMESIPGLEAVPFAELTDGAAV